ncbi:uncharacterized protein N7477_004874 [Penicillium maclennaniae]|uniref:uncharacterized protein n=1 Tax=Penicillium maclennaniae TaxID=1343394 RepID=UPI0025400DE9|nr:uncharacterized protein N7477_004874 [Penicillium maclennaniae]KAJ5674940.1 hypothetical protein N7477_004874 [Penicillium maclennaniae]
MFKALMGGVRSSSDVRSTTSSSSKSRRKTDSKSSHSRKSSRGDDRDRGLGDLSAYEPSASSSRRGPASVAGESVASTYVTAEPDPIDPYTAIVERTPKRRDSDRDSVRSRRRERDRSESRDRDKRKSRRSTADELDDDWERERGERDRRERRRTQSGDHYMPPVSTSMPPSAPGAQFAADIAAPGFSQFPMQYDNSIAPNFSPPHTSAPSLYDPHVPQQFPGQFPTGTAEPYLPYHPAGAAADYYGDQGQSVSEQPGVRPQKPLVNSQEHLMAASPSVNPPPEPSSLGQIGAAAAYFDDATPIHSASNPPSGSSSKPPKPGKTSKPRIIHRQTNINRIHTHKELSPVLASLQQPTGLPAQTSPPSSSKPPHYYGVGTGIGVAAAGAAAGYMLSHHDHHDHHDHPENPAQHPHYNVQNYEESSQFGLPPYASGSNNVTTANGDAGYAGPTYAQHVAHHGPGYYPQAVGAGALAMQHRQRGPLTKFVDFWRDPEGVGRFEDYTETIGVCRYCFDPQSTSLNAPRKHNYHARRHSSDRYSSSSNSRVNKLSRYHSSEDERGRRKKSKKSSSWLPGVLTGYAAKSIFAGKDFDDSYSVRSGRPSGERTSSHDETTSYTSRGLVRRSRRNSPREYYYEDKHSQRNRSQSSSRSRHSSFMKEAALGAAVGGAALAVSKQQRDRSRSTSRVQRRKDSSSSSSFVDVSRPAAKSVGGFTSFFTSSSENRRNTRAKRSKSFFSFRSSSSSSLDNDLAFGDGFSKKPPNKLKKQRKGKKPEDVDAALLGLGATATALAAANSHGRSRSTGQILTARESRSRHSDYGTSANEDDEWIDADSDDHSSSSANSALAFGASSSNSSSESSSGGWGWGWGKKKQKKKDKKTSNGKAALAAGAGALGGAALASVARRRDSRPSSSAGSLQQVYPVPTSDPGRFDVGRATPDPAAVPPIFANEFDRNGHPHQASRDASWNPGSVSYPERRQPRRSNSSPVFPIQESSVFSQKRRSTIKDQASVSFNLTEEQAERERRLSLTRRQRESREDFRDDHVQLIDREEESARLESERRDREERERKELEREVERERKREREREWERERAEREHEREVDREREERERERTRERRRKERDDEKRRSDSDKEKDPSKWVEAAAIGAIGAAAATSIISHKSKKDEEDASEASSRRRERRRAERRAESSIVSKSDVSVPVEAPEPPVDYTDYREESHPRRSPRPAQVYDDYAEFFAPEEVRHSPNEQSRRRGSDESGDKPEIIEVVPASEREKEEAKDEPTDLPQFGPEPYEDREHLPWPVPRLNYIEPTPPHSINGSVRGAASPVIAPVQKGRDESSEVVREERREEHRKEPRSEPWEAPQESPKRERSTTGSRVSWGPHSTHEYDVPSSSEPEFSPTPDDFQDISIDFPEKEKSKDLPKSKETSNPDFGDDIEFAATVAAATEAAGFDPSFVIDDPKYHKRTSPPGSEDEGTFSPTSKWTPVPEQPHGFIEGEIESPDVSKSKDDVPKQFIDKDSFYAEPESFCKENDSSKRREVSIAQEVIEQLNGKHGMPSSPENDVLSMPGGFDNFNDSREVEPYDDRSVFSAPPVRASESKTKSKKSRRSGNDVDFARDLPRESSHNVPRDFPVDAVSPAAEDHEIDDKEEKPQKRRSKEESDVFAIDDDARSAITSIEDVEKSERRKHRSSRSRDLDDAASVASSPAKFDDSKGPITPLEDTEQSERRKHRSSRSREFEDTASARTTLEDDEKSERRKHRSSRSSRETSPSTPLDDDGKSERRRHRSRSSRDFDDAASAITNADDDEKSERRKHRRAKRDSDTFSAVDDEARSAITSIDDVENKDDKELKEKSSSGGLFRSLFGSRVSEPARSRSNSRSSSVDKRPSREAVSEAGVDDERRRRKKKHRSSSGGDSLRDDGSDKESVRSMRSSRSDANLEEYRSSRQKKEERRRHKYEDIVDSGRRGESEKV